MRDRLYLNVGPDARGRSRFREVAEEAGIETHAVEHGLGAAFTDVDGDGRVDLYVANDLDPNRLYLNVPAAGGLGFRLEERGAAAGVADRNAGMGIAAADASGDGRPDLFVTNSHRQLHGVFRSRGSGFAFADARPDFAQAFDTTLAGWGASWADLDLDGRLDLALANGAVPVTNLEMDAEPVKVLGGDAGRSPTSAPASAWATARSSTAVAWPPRTTTTTETSTSPWARSPASSCSSETQAPRATGSRSGSARSRPARGSRRCSPTGAGSSGRCRQGGATSRRRIPGPTSASEARRSSERSSCAIRTAARSGCVNVAVDRLVAVEP